MSDIDLTLLRVLGLKGMADDATVAGALRSPDTAARLEAAVAGGDARKLPRGYALTPQGREKVKAALADEQSAVDGAVMAALYERFCDLNGTFKALMHAWQIREIDGRQVPNDHQDRAYDEGIIARLEAIDAGIQPLLVEIAAAAPRLAAYPARFADALAALRGGDNTMMARPMIDSYHTVWFELHEDLISLDGKTRAEEAAAGRGA